MRVCCMNEPTLRMPMTHLLGGEAGSVQWLLGQICENKGRGVSNE